jgi:hypothetical protein
LPFLAIPSCVAAGTRWHHHKHHDPNHLGASQHHLEHLFAKPKTRRRCLSSLHRRSAAAEPKPPSAISIKSDSLWIQPPLTTFPAGEHLHTVSLSSFLSSDQFLSQSCLSLLQMSGAIVSSVITWPCVDPLLGVLHATETLVHGRRDLPLVYQSFPWWLSTWVLPSSSRLDKNCTLVSSCASRLFYLSAIACPGN